MSLVRDDIWRDLREKRADLKRSLDAAQLASKSQFTEEDWNEWAEIDAALDYEPEKHDYKDR